MAVDKKSARYKGVAFRYDKKEGTVMLLNNIREHTSYGLYDAANRALSMSFTPEQFHEAVKRLAAEAWAAKGEWLK